jgi:hypothetical protein
MIFVYVFAAILAALYCWRRENDFAVAGIGFLVGLILAGVVYYGPMYWQASDLELLSGSVVAKKRVYDPETESYDCGKDSQGNTKTCTREIPRWRWDVISDIDSDKFSEHTYQSIRSPDIYSRTQIGDPYTAAHRFLNFQNVSEQSVLLDRESADGYVGWLPEYPQVYSGFKVQRGFSTSPLVDQRVLSNMLNVAQKRWGPMHGVNVMVVVIGPQADANKFYYALKSKWKGGKKNDAVLIVRVDEEGRMTNTNSFSRSADNLLNEEGRAFTTLLHVNAMKTYTAANKKFDPEQIIASIDQSLKYFQREDLGRYDFLKDEYMPPYWLVALSVIVTMLGVVLTVNYIVGRRNPYDRFYRKFGFL